MTRGHMEVGVVGGDAEVTDHDDQSNGDSVDT
jgi:hypothetical protein